MFTSIKALLSVLAVFASTDTLELDLLREAQKANVGRYPHGELKATLKWGQYAKITTHSYAETRLVWAEDKLWADVLEWGRHDHEFRPEPGKANHEYWIVERRKLINYVPGARRAFISSPARVFPENYILLTPSASWYGKTCGSGLYWRDILDPKSVSTTDTKGTDPESPVYSVVKKSDDLTEVVVRYPRYKVTYKLLFSFAADGNPLEYEYQEPAPERTVRGVCEWKRDDRARLYLSKLGLTAVHADNKTRTYLEYNLLEFNPDFAPGKGQFEIDSLKLPDGTAITDELTGRNRRIGDRPVSSVVDRLGELIDVMRSRGFAAEGRK